MVGDFSVVMHMYVGVVTGSTLGAGTARVVVKRAKERGIMKYFIVAAVG